MVRPAQSCLGCCSLLVGVEVICLASIVADTVFIAICSSTEPLQVAGLVMPPTVQVAVATWAFVGIPLAVAGGVGVLHRIEQNVRVFFHYLLGSFFLILAVPVWFLSTNSLCDVVVHPDLQSQGTVFVCGFADSFIFAWTLMLALIHAYMVYIVWSAAEDIRICPYPELLRYEEALRSAKLPPIEEETGPSPDMMARSAFGVAPPQMQYPPPSMGPLERAPGPVSMALDAAAAAAATAAPASRWEGSQQATFLPAPPRSAFGPSAAAPTMF